MTGADAHVQGHLVLRERVLRERPGGDEAAAQGTRGECGDAAQAQRDAGEPDRAPDHHGQERPARVRQQDRHEQQAEDRVGQRADRRVSLSPRAEPERAGDAHGGHQADGVPVAERLAQAGEDLVGREGAGEDLREHRVAGDHGRADDGGAEQCRPAVRAQPGERHAGGERGDVGQRAVGLQPRVGRVDRPPDRRGRQRGEGAEGGKAPGAVQSPAPAYEDGDRAQRAADDLHDHLDLGGAAELQPASGPQGDRREQQAHDDRPQAVRGRLRQLADAAAHPVRHARRQAG